MREYTDRTMMNSDFLVQGELIKYQDKIYRVEISNVGSLNNSHVRITLSPVNYVLINNQTEVVINAY